MWRREGEKGNKKNCVRERERKEEEDRTKKHDEIYDRDIGIMLHRMCHETAQTAAEYECVCERNICWMNYPKYNVCKYLANLNIDEKLK